MKRKYKIFGKKVNSPFVLGSGPLSYGAEGIKTMFNSGIDIVVTKTIRIEAANNPIPHMVMNSTNGLINNELWSDYSYEHWINEEFPSLKDRESGVLIASLGHTLDELRKMLQGINDSSVDAIELVSYEPQELLPMLKFSKENTNLPIIVKLPSRMDNLVETAIQLEELGADAITACDSVGPTLRIDIKTKKKQLGGKGTGWITGNGILPITLYNINEIKKKVAIPIIGLGGCMSESDAVEMILAGASYPGICTYPIIKGKDSIVKLNDKFENLLNNLKVDDICDIVGKAQDCINDSMDFEFLFMKEKCVFCKRCQTVCAYKSRKIDTDMHLNENTCRKCGLCVSVCPTEALILKK